MTKDDIILRLTAKLERTEQKINDVESVLSVREDIGDSEKIRRIDNIVTCTTLLWFELEGNNDSN